MLRDYQRDMIRSLFLVGLDPSPVVAIPARAGKSRAVRPVPEREEIRLDVVEAVCFSQPPFSMEWRSHPVHLGKWEW